MDNADYAGVATIYPHYSQNLILCHIMLIFPKPANFAENCASLIRQSLVHIGDGGNL